MASFKEFLQYQNAEYLKFVLEYEPDAEQIYTTGIPVIVINLFLQHFYNDSKNFLLEKYRGWYFVLMQRIYRKYVNPAHIIQEIPDKFSKCFFVEIYDRSLTKSATKL